MARRNGCQLPAHSLQVLAISVFFMLSIAFYAFFAPFLGKQIFEHVAITLYSVFIFSVIFLYIRCAVIDPADSGILIMGGVSAYKSQSGVGYGEPNQNGLNPELKTSEKKITTCSQIICCFYGLMVKEDCRNNVDTTQQLNYDEGLYCTLCNAEVGKLSKHCSSCDKCVDGFDHHCRWLNNCIGRKNYVTFLLLMTASLALVAVECGVGIAVLVRCFVNKTAVQNEVIDRLGDIFSRMLVIIVVTSCTALALIAMVPLGELFFFHMILIKKGITTYDFVVALRTQSESPMHEEHHSLPSSPASSAPTAISVSSLGVHHKGAWCTPPRIVANKPEEIMAKLERNCMPSNIVPDAPGAAESAKRASKQPIRISAWKLAKLNSNEAMKAGARARASSSVLRPISSHTNSPNSQQGTPTVLPFKGSYPLAPCALGSPLVVKVQQHSTKHFNNPIFRSSTIQSPYSTKTSDGEESTSAMSFEHGAVGSGDGSGASKANTSSFVHWDQEAGRFVSSQNFVESSSSRSGSHAELVYIGNSIFSGGPLLNERTLNSRIGRGSTQLPVFVPSELNQQNK